MSHLPGLRLGSPHATHLSYSRWPRLTALILLSALSSFGSTQKIGTLYAEVHPTIAWQKCIAGMCTTQAGRVVLDVGKRPVHTSSNQPCWQNDAWDTTYCPPNDSLTCTNACYVDGADYAGSYGVTTSGNAITLKYLTRGPYSDNVGSRVYLMDTTDTKYEIFKLLNREFVFDVDASRLPCGLKGSLYFVGMEEDGGKAKYGASVAGPKYGTGYCDAKCARTIFINGQANPYDYLFSPPTTINQNLLEAGSCCAEVDLWNANSISTQLNILPCQSATDQVKCTNADWSCLDIDEQYSSFCDPYGCDWNPYRMGGTTFYGPGKIVNSNSKITVITQFITDTGTDTGNLAQIKRIYVQNGVVIQNANINIAALPVTNVLTDSTCSSQKLVFGDEDRFSPIGGFHQISETLRKGMVLAMSIADDPVDHMHWLNSNYPVENSPVDPGVARGTCSTATGNPADLEAESPDSSVIFSNLRFGPIGAPGALPGTTTTTTTRTTAAPTQTAATCSSGGIPKWSQCGGAGYTGSGYCCPGLKCVFVNQYYSQCA